MFFFLWGGGGDNRQIFLNKRSNSSCVSFRKPRRRSGGGVTGMPCPGEPPPPSPQPLYPRTLRPYLPGTLEPMLCCKLVRVVLLRVLAQLHEKMVRQDSARSPRSEQHRAQQRYESRRCPMSGRSVHRVRLVGGQSARPPASRSARDGCVDGFGRKRKEGRKEKK